MSKPSVFIDGHVGTTGLVIHQTLAQIADIEILTLPTEQRKDNAARRQMLNQADLAVLCLPDAAAREAVALIENPDTRVLDASTAHRIADGWTYGLPEMTAQQRHNIKTAKRVANPGCYPTTPILALRPLIDAGLLSTTLPLCIQGLSGYTGGGRNLIERWQDEHNNLLKLPYPAPYALDRIHKHIPEMTLYTRLEHRPQFLPAVGPFRCGMRVTIPLHASLLPNGVNAKQLWQALTDHYADEPFVSIAPYREQLGHDEHSLDPQAFNGTNTIELAVLPNLEGHVVIVGRLDNLGKGAGGAAIQNLNIMLDLPEENGLKR